MLSDYKEKNVYYINMRFFMLILFHNILLLNNIVQSRTLNFATSAGAMNRFAPTKVAKFKVRDCTL